MANIVFAILLAAESEGGNPLLSFLPLIAIGFLFYLLMLRPAQKQEKERKAMVAALRKNDRVVTQGGILGTVVRINDDKEEVSLRIDDGRLTVLRGSILRVVSSSTTKEEKKEDKQEESEEDQENSKDA